ncbi:protein CutA homolog isoform X3 [Mixophyes fleayi]|uniref:protein CutA homolog isoform X3 n=1 Tax=Mixophyes fleayi TaxID=3061075 RepID=UPI003F4E3529
MGSWCQRFQAPSQSWLRPGWMPVLLVMIGSCLMYPVLRSIIGQIHTAVTGSYLPGTHSLAFINCPNEQLAKDIARGILEKKLAASVNIMPKSSSLLVHPFETPDFVTVPIDQGNPDYFKWIEEVLLEK